MKSVFLVRGLVLVIVAAGIVLSCKSTQRPEEVAIDFLNACRDGDERTIAPLSIIEECLPVLKWRRTGGESHRDDQGKVRVLLEDLRIYRQAKERLLELAHKHQRLFHQPSSMSPEAVRERDRELIAARDDLLVKLERLKEKHAGMFAFWMPGCCHEFLKGK